MRTLPEVNARLDHLYARQYDLECVCLYELDQDEHTEWVRVYESITNEIMELECRQDELLADSVYAGVDRDCEHWVQRQAGY